jgi:hypothetical protein
LFDLESLRYRSPGYGEHGFHALSIVAWLVADHLVDTWLQRNRLPHRGTWLNVVDINELRGGLENSDSAISG